MDIGAAVARDEKGGIRFLGNMLDMDMVSAVLTEALQQHIRVFGRFQWVDQRVFTAGKIVLLNINNDQSGSHRFSNRGSIEFPKYSAKIQPAIDRMNDTLFF